MYTTHSLKTRIILTRAISKLATTTLTLMDCETQDQMSKDLQSQKHLIRTQIQDTWLCSHTYYQLQVQILGPEMLGKHQHYCIGYSWLWPWSHPELTKTPMTGHTSFEVERLAGTSSFVDRMDTWNFCSKVATIGLAGSQSVSHSNNTLLCREIHSISSVPLENPD